MTATLERPVGQDIEDSVRVRVIRDAFIFGPNSKSDRRTKKVQEVVFEDGSSVFRCSEGDFEAATLHYVYGHRRKAHSSTPGETRGGRKPLVKEIESLPTEVLLAEIARRIEAKPDKYKQRALTAERRLSTLKRALN